MRQSHRPLSGRESKRRSSAASVTRSGRRFAPGVERLEARELLANSFLQGVVYHDLNNNGALDASDPRLAGSTVRVFQGQTQVRQTVTGADGYYLFTDLAPNNYRIEQTPPQGFYASSAQALSDIMPAAVGGANQINVNLLDSDGFQAATYEDMVSFINLPNGVRLFGQIPIGFQPPNEGPTGQFLVDITRPPAPNVDVRSFCMDLLNADFFPFFGFVPDPLQGPIGYLFNHYGTNDLTPVQAAALQLVLWEILYDPTNYDLTAGNFEFIYNADPNLRAQILAQGNAYLAEATGQSEPALFLRTIEDKYQAFIGKGSFNFGNRPTAGLSGYKWHDQNANSQWDAGEPALANWTIYLDLNNNGALNAGEPQTQTDANGRYEFQNLVPGTYVIREVLQTNWVQSYPSAPGSHVVTLASGQNLAGRPLFAEVPNFGNYQRAGLSGYKWHDLNANGQWEANEPGLADWTIEVRQGNALIATTTTGADGQYTVSGLTPGTYEIREVLQAGWTQSYPGTPGVHTITLTSGQNFVSPPLMAAPLNFGNWLPATLGGQVTYQEPDCFGMQDRGPQAGVTIRLLRDNVQIATFVTGADGRFTFGSLTPGIYTVVQVVAGWTQLSGPPGAFVLTSGQTIANANFRNEFPLNPNLRCGRISGQITHQAPLCVGVEDRGPRANVRVYIDANNNAQFDPGEQNALTDANGNYTITETGAGTHRVRFVTEPGWTTIGPAFIDVVQPGPIFTAANINFRFQLAIDPNLRCGRLSGRVTYQVPLCEGVEDRGGRAGVRVYIDANNNAQFDPGEQNAITDANGNYVITETGAGTHRVRVQTQADWTIIGAPFIDVVQPGPVFEAGNLNFRVQLPPTDPLRCGSISGRVTLQVPTCDGVQDRGGRPSVTVYIDANNNNQLDAGEQSVVTDASGNYRITPVGAGTSRVRILTPANTTVVGQAFFDVVQQTPTFTVTGINFRLEQPSDVPLNCGSIAGRVVYQVRNCDGVVPRGGLSGLTIYIDANDNSRLDDGERRTVTDASGNYRLTEIGAGTSRVRYVLTGRLQNLGRQFADVVHNGPSVNTTGVDFQLEQNDLPENCVPRVPDQGTDLLPSNPGIGPPVLINDLGGKIQLLGSSIGQNGTLLGNAAFVTGLYRNVLGRAPDDSGLVFWVQALQGGLARSQAVAAIWNSVEHRGQQVDYYYATYLGRRSDPAGRAGWVNALVNGLPEKAIVARFVGSPEYFVNSRSDNPTFVSRMYAQLLNRQPEATGHAAWVQALATGTSREGLAQAFLNARETSGRVLDLLYSDYLGRQPEPTGREAWLNALSRNQIAWGDAAQGILASQEYFNRLHDFARSNT